MVTTADYARLSDAAYDDSGAPDGWTRIANSEPSSNNSGYQGAAFRKEGTNEIVVANRGTEPFSEKFADIGADKQMAEMKVPDQYQDARNFLSQVQDANRGAEVSITGHSLGGSLSQLLGAETEEFWGQYI